MYIFHLDSYYQSITTLSETNGVSPFQVCVCGGILVSKYFLGDNPSPATIQNWPHFGITVCRFKSANKTDKPQPNKSCKHMKHLSILQLKGPVEGAGNEDKRKLAKHKNRSGFAHCILHALMVIDRLD